MRAWVNVVLVGMGALVLVAAVSVAGLTARTTAASDQLSNEVQPASAEAFRIQSALLGQQSGLRGYLVGGDPELLRAYREGIREEDAAAARMRKIVAGMPQAAADLAALREAARTWREERAEPLIAMVRREGTGSVDAETAQDSTSFAPVRELLARQNGHLARDRGDARADQDRTRTQRDVVLWALLGVLLLAGVVLTVLLHTLLVRPLRALRYDSKRVAEGAFTHSITPTGPADLRAVGQDVEDMRLRLVEALEESRAQQDLLIRQAAALDARAGELERSNAELEQFAYVASHDLQEPLRKVASFCQLLEKRYGEQLDERAVQYIDFAVDGAKRMQVLINDLLTFSRVGRVNDARVELLLDTALDKALDNLATPLEEWGAQVRRPDELPRITGDHTLLTMLWQNLVGNAVKFRAPDRTPDVRIEVAPYRDDNDAEGWSLSVTDNGIGISPEFAEKIFVIFQRLHSRDAYAGTGIGLALCKKIVEYHGGRIWLDPSYQGGTRICFTLLADAAPPEALDTEGLASALSLPAQPGATA